MDDERTEAGPEWRAGFEPFRRRGGDGLMAAGTEAAMAVDAGDDGAERRQVDVVVGMDVGLVGGAEGVGLNDIFGEMFGADRWPASPR